MDTVKYNSAIMYSEYLYLITLFLALNILFFKQVLFSDTDLELVTIAVFYFECY